MYTMSLKKMDGDVPENGIENSGAVSYDLLPTNNDKTMNSMKVPYYVKRIGFDPSKADSGETLEVHVPKLNKNEVLVPGSLALRFDIDHSGGHANNYLVQKMHGSGTRLVNTTDGVKLEINRNTGKGPFNCHVFVISDVQFNIQNKRLDSVMY